MYTILSLIFVTCLWPLSWAIALLLISFFSKKPKRKKRALLCAIIILVIFSNRFVLDVFARAWDVDPVTLQKGKVYSAAIVLGGFTNEDKNKQGFFTDHSDRLLEAMWLQSTGKVSRIMMSGGNSDPNADGFTESKWVKKTLTEMRYPDSAVLIDQRSRNTYENATFTKSVLDSAHLKPPYLLVTSAFHMRRAMYNFKKKGMDVIPYPCDYMAGKAPLWIMDYFVPNVNVMFAWDFYLKEVFGLVAEHFKS